MRLQAVAAGLAHNHIFAFLRKAANREVDIIGAVESDPELRAEAIEKGVDCKDTTAEALFQTAGADFAVIGAPYADRGELVIKALRAGLHVLSDKPLCTSRAELDEIRNEAVKRGLAVGIMLDLVDFPAFRAAVGAARRGTIGRINNILFEGQHPLMVGCRPRWYFEEGRWGGVFNDIGIHAVDLAEKLIGSPICDINAARCWNFYAKDTPHFKDSGQVMLTAMSGCGVIGDVSYAVPDSWGYALPAYWHFRVWGSGGMMEFSANRPEVTIYISGKQDAKTLLGEENGPDYLESFLTAVKDPEYRKNYTERMLHIQKTALAIQEKADEGKESLL